MKKISKKMIVIMFSEAQQIYKIKPTPFTMLPLVLSEMKAKGI